MRNLLMKIGDLVALRQLNRDELAESIGMTRQNLIASLKGRRPLPQQYYTLLKKNLQLDEVFLLRKDRIHALIVSKIEKNYKPCYNVLYSFLEFPLKKIAIIRGIGEKTEECAYILQDARKTYVLVHDCEKSLAFYDINYPYNSTEELENNSISIENNIINQEKDMQNVNHKTVESLFLLQDYVKQREIPLKDFYTIMQQGITLERLEELLKADSTVWTWSRIQEEAETRGILVEDVAKVLGLNK